MNDQTRLCGLIEVKKADLEKALARKAEDDSEVAHALHYIGGLAASAATEEINRALDVDVYGLIAHAWSKVQAIRESAERSKREPGPSVVTFGEHDFTYTCYPVLTFYLDETPLPELRLTLELVARFESVALSIVEGRLRSIAPGKASAIARLKYKETEIVEKKSADWKLPGEVGLGAGVPVA